MLVYGFSFFSNVPPGIFYLEKLCVDTTFKVKFTVSFTLEDCNISGANLDNELDTPTNSRLG